VWVQSVLQPWPVLQRIQDHLLTQRCFRSYRQKRPRRVPTRKIVLHHLQNRKFKMMVLQSLQNLHRTRHRRQKHRHRRPLSFPL
jgi:hypothetical protein